MEKPLFTQPITLANTLTRVYTRLSNTGQPIDLTPLAQAITHARQLTA